jgi:hypothetical protein
VSRSDYRFITSHRQVAATRRSRRAGLGLAEVASYADFHATGITAVVHA